MHFDRFDICDAYYWYATCWHGGQFTREYKILGRLYKLGYSPSPAVQKGNLNSNAYEIYESLVARGLK